MAGWTRREMLRRDMFLKALAGLAVLLFLWDYSAVRSQARADGVDADARVRLGQVEMRMHVAPQLYGQIEELAQRQQATTLALTASLRAAGKSVDPWAADLGRTATDLPADRDGARELIARWQHQRCDRPLLFVRTQSLGLGADANTYVRLLSLAMSTGRVMVPVGGWSFAGSAGCNTAGWSCVFNVSSCGTDRLAAASMLDHSATFDGMVEQMIWIEGDLIFDPKQYEEVFNLLVGFNSDNWRVESKERAVTRRERGIGERETHTRSIGQIGLVRSVVPEISRRFGLHVGQVHGLLAEAVLALQPATASRLAQRDPVKFSKDCTRPSQCARLDCLGMHVRGSDFRTAMDSRDAIPDREYLETLDALQLKSSFEKVTVATDLATRDGAHFGAAASKYGLAPYKFGTSTDSSALLKPGVDVSVELSVLASWEEDRKYAKPKDRDAKPKVDVTAVTDAALVDLFTLAMCGNGFLGTGSNWFSIIAGAQFVRDAGAAVCVLDKAHNQVEVSGVYGHEVPGRSKRVCSDDPEFWRYSYQYFWDWSQFGPEGYALPDLEAEADAAGAISDTEIMAHAPGSRDLDADASPGLDPEDTEAIGDTGIAEAASATLRTQAIIEAHTLYANHNHPAPSGDDSGEAEQEVDQIDGASEQAEQEAESDEAHNALDGLKTKQSPSESLARGDAVKELDKSENAEEEELAALIADEEQIEMAEEKEGLAADEEQIEMAEEKEGLAADEEQIEMAEEKEELAADEEQIEMAEEKEGLAADEEQIEMAEEKEGLAADEEQIEKAKDDELAALDGEMDGKALAAEAARERKQRVPPSERENQRPIRRPPSTDDSTGDVEQILA